MDFSDERSIAAQRQALDREQLQRCHAAVASSVPPAFRIPQPLLDPAASAYSHDRIADC
jgi:hypothetical protein